MKLSLLALLPLAFAAPFAVPEADAEPEADALAQAASPAPAPFSVTQFYRGGGCTQPTNAQTIYGSQVGQCVPLYSAYPITSAKSTYVRPGCSLRLFLDGACKQPNAGGFLSPQGGCVQGSTPFKSARLSCP